MNLIIAQQTSTGNRRIAAATPPTNGILIFLDDIEGDNSPRTYKFGGLSTGFVKAFLQEAGPIIVSASLIMNVCETKKLKERDPEKIFQRFVMIASKLFDGTVSDEEEIESKNIILSLVDFTTKVARDWIIKEINSSLYLLVPKSYLQSKNIAEVDVEEFTARKPLTPTEQLMGLKLNHMRTVALAEVKKPIRSPLLADYFFKEVWNKKMEYSTIFVTNSEYKMHHNKAIPRWVFYISGHGQLNYSIVSLSLMQFKDFLAFLEGKITTRLLYYNSCYAAGINSEILYRDAEKEITKSYSFAIITQALTDAYSANTKLGISVESSRRAHKITTKLIITIYGNYAEYIRKSTSSDIINYREIAALLTPVLHVSGGVQSLPQIRFPGLPWFSVVDDDKVVSLGSILVKSRTAGESLNIAHFFRREGKMANPLGILLYASSIPFELIIDTKAIVNDPPAIISMIPGNAAHYIGKIYSAVHSVDALLNSFLSVVGLAPVKTFVIEEITGQLSETISDLLTADRSPRQTISYVIIQLAPEANNISFIYKDRVYRITNSLTNTNPPRATSKDIQTHIRKFRFFEEDAKFEQLNRADAYSLHKDLTPKNIEKLRTTLKRNISAQKRGKGGFVNKATQISLATVLQNFGNSLNKVETALRQPRKKKK